MDKKILKLEDVINDKYPFVGIFQEDKVILKQQRAFSAGIRYQKEQSTTDAIDFFKWINLNYVEHHYLYEDDIKVSSYVHRSEGGVSSRIEKLYELWQKIK